MRKKLNYQFGKEISDVADYVVLVGEKQTVEIKKGLLDNKFSEKKIIIFNKIIDAYSFISKLKLENKDKEIYVLFENDLPDIYSEGVKK